MNYLIKLLLDSDSDCYTVRPEDKFISDYEIYETISGNKQQILEHITNSIKLAKSTSYEVAYDKHHIPSIMSKVNQSFRNTLSTIHHNILNDKYQPGIYKFGQGGNQYFNIELAVI